MVLMCLLDSQMGHPQNLVFWYEGLMGRDITRGLVDTWAKREPSRILTIATKGWSSVIVLAFYGTAVLSVAIISVRLHLVQCAEIQKHLERRHSGGSANHVKAV